ncbi:MAG: hypothetical protein RR263_02645 [Oscillospiraceae bacterium]
MENSKTTQFPPHLVPTSGKTMVLVTNQFKCERIIKAGRIIADLSNTDLVVLNVQDSSYPPNPQAIQHLFNVSKENNAVMNVAYSDNASRTIVHFIKNTKPHNILSGMPQGNSSVLQKIWKKFIQLNFFVVGEDGKPQPVNKLMMASIEVM